MFTRQLLSSYFLCSTEPNVGTPQLVLLAICRNCWKGHTANQIIPGNLQELNNKVALSKSTTPCLLRHVQSHLRSNPWCATLQSIWHSTRRRWNGRFRPQPPSCVAESRADVVDHPAVFGGHECRKLTISSFTLVSIEDGQAGAAHWV